jgi:hypothetical protein
VIKIECDYPYCHQEIDLADEFPKDWRMILVRSAHDLECASVTVHCQAFDLSRLSSEYTIACPNHWRKMAREALETVEIFPEPETEASKAPEPEPAPAADDDSGIQF